MKKPKGFNKFDNLMRKLAKVPPEELREQRCKAAQDGECIWGDCPQRRDSEPAKTGRTCPLSWRRKDEQ